MSARRAAKAHRGLPPARVSDGVPACLKVGACIEVWAASNGDPNPLTAYRRHREARAWWLEAAGVTDVRQACELIPAGAPWSVTRLSYPGQADRAGRPAAEIVRDRLDRAGCTLADLSELYIAAQDLHALAHRDARELRRRRREGAA